MPRWKRRTSIFWLRRIPMLEPFRTSNSLLPLPAIASSRAVGREVTVRELPIALAAVNMRLTPGGIREMHWHKENTDDLCSAC